MVQEQDELNSQVGSKQLEELQDILNSMFEGDFFEQGIIENDVVVKQPSKAYLKALMTYNNMVLRKWTIEEFRETMKQLTKRWDKGFWMPADILRIHANLYGEERLDG